MTSLYNFIDSSRMTTGWLKRGGEYSFNKNEVKESKEKVLFLGFFVKHWGHFLIDCMDRMWILNNPKFNDYKVVYLDENNNHLSGNYLSLLKYLGVSKDRIVTIDKPTRFQEVILPEPCRLDDHTYYDEYKGIFNKIVSGVDIDDFKINSRVYLSRTHLNNGQEFGERRIEKAFKDNGFSVMYPEELSFEEQVAVFQKANQIVCVNGSIPLNALFSSDKLKLTVLNKTRLVHQNMLNVATIMNLKVSYIDAYFEPIQNHPKFLGQGPFWIEFNKNLTEYFKDNNLNYKVYVETNHNRQTYIKYIGTYFKNNCINFAVKLKHKVMN